MYSFKKAEHLKSKKTIELLFSEGNVLNDYPLKMFWIKRKEDPSNASLQVAFSVSKRKHAKAVVRNRIKRLMREVYRLHKLPLCAYLEESETRLAIMFIYTGKKLPRYNEIEAKIIQLLDRLPDEVNRNGNEKH